MKLWGWWKKSGEQPPQQTAEPELLDDLPPKFEDTAADTMKAEHAARLSLSKMLKSIGLRDFVEMPQVPCFRNAMLTGLGMGFTAGTVMFVSRRSVPRALNWFVGGFSVGAIMSWEQCRFRIMRGKRNVRQAQEAYKQRDGSEQKSGSEEKPSS